MARSTCFGGTWWLSFLNMFRHNDEIRKEVHRKERDKLCLPPSCLYFFPRFTVAPKHLLQPYSPMTLQRTHAPYLRTKNALITIPWQHRGFKQQQQCKRRFNDTCPFSDALWSINRLLKDVWVWPIQHSPQDKGMCYTARFVHSINEFHWFSL